MVADIDGDPLACQCDRRCGNLAVEKVGLAVVYCFDCAVTGSWAADGGDVVRILYGAALGDRWMGIAHQMG